MSKSKNVVPNFSKETTPTENINNVILENVMALTKEVGELKADVSHLKEDVNKLMPSYNNLVENEKRKTKRNKTWVWIGKILASIITLVLIPLFTSGKLEDFIRFIIKY